MSIRFHKYGVLLAFLALGMTTGCESQRNTGTGPSPIPASFKSGVSTTFNFEPATLRPELIPGTSCVAFGTRIIIVVTGESGVVLRGLRFRLTDRHGVNALPRVMAIPGASPLSSPAPGMPSSFPIPTPGLAPLPSTMPIPMPGPSAVNGFLVPAGASEQLPFFLFFDCGVAPEGFLFIGTEVVEQGGMTQTSEFRVRLGG